MLAHKASILHKELWATEVSWEWTSITTVCLIIEPRPQEQTASVIVTKPELRSVLPELVNTAVCRHSDSPLLQVKRQRHEV